MAPGSKDMFCLGCRYPLHSLDSRRCPECGRPFDPADPATFARSVRCWRMPWLGLAALLVGLVASVVGLGQVSGSRMRAQNPQIIIPLYAAVGGLATAALRRGPWTNRVLGVVALLFLGEYLEWLLSHTVVWPAFWEECRSYWLGW